MKLHDMWWAPFLQLPAWLYASLRGNWTPRFPRAWRGRRVTVCHNGRTWTNKMQTIRSTYFELWTLSTHLEETPFYTSPKLFEFKDEGRTWCIGWFGPQVNALKTAQALETT